MLRTALSIWRKRIGLVVLISLSTSLTASAQAPQERTPGQEQAVKGQKPRIVSVAGGNMTTGDAGNLRRVPTADAMQVRVRHSDSVLNGALIGAGVGVVSGLFYCRLYEPWDICRSDIGSMLRFGAIGAGAGIAVDAIIRGQKTIYPAVQPSRLHATPVIGRRAAGLQFSFNF